MMRLPVLLLALAFGCVVQDVNHDGVEEILVMGDSNTMAFWSITQTQWVEKLDVNVEKLNASFNLNWHLNNIAWMGMTACDFNNYVGTFSLAAPKQLPGALDFFKPDLIIFAYGTNDITLGAMPAKILQCYQDLRTTAAAQGVPSMVALTPHLGPTFPSQELNLLIDELDALLKANLPPRDIIDFASNMAPEDYADAKHFTDSGQVKRAAAAYSALMRP